MACPSSAMHRLIVLVALFGFVGVTGVLGANCMARLLEHYPQQAGAAAGFAVATQFGLGAATSSLISATHDGSPLPMAIIIGICGIGSLLALVLASTPSEHPPQP